MMSIGPFMIQHATEIRREVMPKLNAKFNSHQFIQKFSRHYQGPYVEALNERRLVSIEGIFKYVHREIITTVRDHGGLFGINRVGAEKVPSTNIFGEPDRIQLWEKML